MARYQEKFPHKQSYISISLFFSIIGIYNSRCVTIDCHLVDRKENDSKVTKEFLKRLANICILHYE